MSNQRQSVAAKQNEDSDPAPPQDPTVITVDIEDEEKLAGLLDKAVSGSRTDRRKRKRDNGRVDVEPDISTESIEGLERERQREQLARITPRTREPPATTAFREAQEARRQADLLESTLAEQSAIAAQNISDAQSQIDMLEENPGRYTIDGKLVTRKIIAGLKKNLADYKQGYIDYVKDVSEATTEQRVYANATLRAIGEWSSKVVERGKDVKRQEQNFDSQLQTNIGFGSFSEASPREQVILGKITPGIPGPGLGPAPGSFGEKLQNTFGIPASKVVRKGLEASEKPFRSLTEPIRKAGESAIEAAVKQPSLIGVAPYLTGVGLGVVASGLDVATFGIRPGLQVETAKALGSIVTDRETQQDFKEKIAKDPFKFVAETIGGAALGSKLASIGETLITERGPIIKTLRAELNAPSRALWEPRKGLYGTVESPPRSSLREIFKRTTDVAKRGTRRLDFNQLLKEEMALYEFPSETLSPEFLQRFTPENTFTVDSTFNKKFGKWSEALTQENFGITPTKGTTIRTGKSGYLGFGRTGAELESIIIPKEFAVPTTIYRFRETGLNIPSGSPRIPISSVPPSLGITKGISLIDVLSGANIATGGRSLLRQRTPQIQKPRTVQQNIQAFNTNLTRNIQKSFTFTGQLPALTLGEVQKQTPIQKQKSLQIPMLDIPPFPPVTIIEPDFDRPPNFFLVPPRISRKKTIPVEEKKKKKKKKPKKRKGIRDILEFRVDPLKGIKIGRRKL